MNGPGVEMIELAYPIELGVLAVEQACCEICKRSGHYMNGFTLFVNSAQVTLALRLMSAMPRIGVILDDSFGSCEWMLVGITQDLRLVGRAPQGLLMIYTTQAELDAAVAKWKPILRLQDWEARAVLGPYHLVEAEGRCIVSLARKTVTISVANNPQDFGDQDMEDTLVHELLHAHFQAFAPEKRESLAYELWEQSVDQLARAFVALSRKGSGLEARSTHRLEADATAGL